MSKPRGTTYTFAFATAICFFCSLILAVSAIALQPRQKDNIKLDIVQNILISVGHVKGDLKKITPADNFDLFKNEIETILINKDDETQTRDFMVTELKKLGYEDEVLTDMTEGELLSTFEAKLYLLAKKAGTPKAEYNPGYKLIYVHNPTKAKPEAYVIPIAGYGLWDMVRGYLALDVDLNTVKGITFYDHKETPGLGALITQPWFTDQFKGKEIIGTDGTLASVVITRGKATDTKSGDELVHYVDGISGATLTGDGINKFIKANLEVYEPYFSQLRKTTTQGPTL